MSSRDDERAARAAELEARAAALEARAKAISQSATRDGAYWSQPLAPNGRQSARATLLRADRMICEAEELRREARKLRRPLPKMGDAAEKRAEAAEKWSHAKKGDMMLCPYGWRMISRVNKKTFSFAGALGTITVDKSLVTAIRRAE